jgi:cytoskeletal protein RodZ
VRPAHGADHGVLTTFYPLAMRARVLALLATALVFSAGFGLAACGGNSTAGDVVPKSTPDLTAPAGADALASGTSTDQTPTTSTDTTSTTSTSTTPSTTSTGATSGAAPQTTTTQPQGNTGGTTTTPPQNTTGGQTGTTTSGSTGGTSPGEFNKFCQDNPGACPGN